LKTLTAHTVASRIKAIAPAYETYFAMLIQEGLDGEMISMFKGMSFSDVSNKLERIGLAQTLHRDRVVNELCKLFDPQTYPMQAAAGAQPLPSPVRNSPHTPSCAVHLTCCFMGRLNPTTPSSLAAPLHPMPTL
jgi:hypothetical protein